MNSDTSIQEQMNEVEVEEMNISQLKEKISQLKKQNTDLEIELNNSKKEYNILKKSNSSTNVFQEQLVQSTMKIKELMNEITEKDLKIESMEYTHKEEINKLNNEIKTISNENNLLKAQLNDYNSLKAQNDKLTKKNNETIANSEKDDTEDILKSIDEKNKQIDLVLKERAHFSSTIPKLSKEKLNLQKDKQKNEILLKKYETELKDIKNQTISMIKMDNTNDINNQNFYNITSTNINLDENYLDNINKEKFIENVLSFKIENSNPKEDKDESEIEDEIKFIIEGDEEDNKTFQEKRDTLEFLSNKYSKEKIEEIIRQSEKNKKLYDLKTKELEKEREKYKNLKEEYNDLQNRVKINEEDKIIKEKALKELEEEKAKNESLIKEKQSHESLIIQLQNELKGKELLIENSNKQTQEGIKKMELLIENLKKEQEKEKEKMQGNFNIYKESLITEKEKLEKSKDDLNKNIVTLQKEIEKYKQQVEEAKGEKEINEQIYQTWKNNIMLEKNNLQEEYMKLNEKNKELVIMYDKNFNENEEHKKNVDFLKKESFSLNRQIEELKRQYSKDVKEREIEIQNLNSKIVMYKKKMEELSNKEMVNESFQGSALMSEVLFSYASSLLSEK